MPVNPSRLEEVFLAAAAIPESARSAYLDEACGPEAELRAAVDRLLAAHAEPANILKSHAALPSTDLHNPQPDTGTVLAGRYTLLEEIGEGGMGTVWMARQTEPVKRLVAVKLIKPGMDSRAVLARFEAERQALALMDHPNIARVLDGGLTSDGRPFFVMDLVKGVPITEYCDARKLTPQQRLELFVPVCHAIQHAHQKGIIHRDIKPSNVLVAMFDDRPIPRVIDFGVAKATGQQLTEQTFHTGFGTVIGTPQYMSPEQATFNNLDVDTRSDLYSLGVLLYELLAGSPPFTKRDLEQAGMLEMLRVVREVEPPRPSTKLSTADALPTLAANRSTEPKKLTGMLRNELDWIVMKALEKDRTRRYETANGFAADIHRYLSGEPVQAVPPSVVYMLRKYVRRHRGPVLGVLAVALVFLLGIAGTAFGLVWAEHARAAEAEQKLKTQEQEAARAKAEAEVERKEQAEEQRLQRNHDAVSALLSRLESALRASDARQATAVFEQTKKQIAEGGTNDLKGRLDRCHVELAMLQRLNKIVDEYWKNTTVNAQRNSDFTSRIAAALDGYGITSTKLRPEDGAKRIMDSLIREELLTFLEIFYVSGGRNPDVLSILKIADPDEFRNHARATNYIQAVLSRAFRGKPQPRSQPVWFAIGQAQDQQLSSYTRTQLLLNAWRLSPSSYSILMALGGFEKINDKESAERRIGFYRAALAIDPTSAHAWNELGIALKDMRNLAGAIDCYKETIRLDPKAAKAYCNLGGAFYELGDFTSSINYQNEAIRLNPNYDLAYLNLGLAQKKLRNLPGATYSFEKAIQLNPNFAHSHMYLGMTRKERGNFPGAIEELRKAIDLDSSLVNAHIELGIALFESGNRREAVDSFKEAARLDPENARIRLDLGRVFRNINDMPNAIASFKDAVRLDHKFVSAHYDLGIALLASGDNPGAIDCFKQIVLLDPKYIAEFISLGARFQKSGDITSAIDCYKEAIKHDPKNLGLLLNLSTLLLQKQKHPEAIAYLQEAIRNNRDIAIAHALLGEAVLQTGDIPGARTAWTEAARLDPKRYGTLLAKLPSIPVAPPPREVKP